MIHHFIRANHKLYVITLVDKRKLKEKCHKMKATIGKKNSVNKY
jgi:hypothetical protein